MAGGFVAGVGQGVAQAATEQENQAFELKLQSAKLEQEHQSRLSEQQSAISETETAAESRLTKEQKIAHENYLFQMANGPKLSAQDIAGMHAALGPRETKQQHDLIEGLVGQPVSKLDSITDAASKFKLGNGQIIPVRDGNGVHIADRFYAPDGEPHDLPIAGSADKAKEAALIPQYQNYLHTLLNLHDQITNGYNDDGTPKLDANGNPIRPMATTGPSAYTIPMSGQLGSGALELEGKLGYNNKVNLFNMTHDAMLNLANKAMEDGPSRTSEAMLNLSRAGNIQLSTKNSVVHQAVNEFMDLTNQRLGDLRRLATTSDGLPAPTQVPVPVKQPANDIDAIRAAALQYQGQHQGKSKP